MAFKLGREQGLQANGGNIKSKLKFKNGKEIVPGTPVFKKKLEHSVMAEANMDGSIYINKDIHPDDPRLNQAILHEMQHITAIKLGTETYDDNAVYFHGEAWERKDGYIINPHTGEKLIEGDKRLPWEANKI